MDFLETWGISIAVFVPVVGALIVMLLPKSWGEDLVKGTSLAASLVSGGFGIALLANFDFDRSDKLQFFVNKKWIEAISSRTSPREKARMAETRMMSAAPPSTAARMPTPMASSACLTRVPRRF